ncbi:Crotonobetainyl-CoA:carnitine CoA-transferase CaiB [Nocardia amikacinitolerans]|uniref:CaiB/BaiF CoA-transferase family protein n=1 Tax=Nocardia amikacinitolerans TaxID=756689 RepID=UPI00083726C1|nr:CoA transferase [Nocardia amikacinitolerans]MCP2317677.1 Crotonobetainyl-CoA:carnitine CoA-transferase CaiB [Nocardia amikacinitolerans]
MTESQALQIVELTRSVAGAACGRLFAGLGHEVTLCEPAAGHPLRAREFTFTATAAGKRSIVCDPTLDLSRWEALLSSADMLIFDLPPSETAALGLDPERLAKRFPRLVTVSLTAFGLDGELAETPGDSFLADAYGGLAQMIGEPDGSPLSLGGEQTAYVAAFVGLLGASLALRNRARIGIGDHVEVALSDVAAYMDWKSDVTYELTDVVPLRTGAARGSWRIVEAKDGWVGVIYLPDQWPAVVELIGDDRLADPDFLDPHIRVERAEELWPVITDAIGRREAYEVYTSAQRLGLPFGYVATAADLVGSDQLAMRGFIVPPERRRRDAPVVSFPLPDGRAAEVERAPALGEDAIVRRAAAAVPSPSAEVGANQPGTAPLAGLLVLDFGTITAGAATGRLLADYGATVIKIESSARPDKFRQWVMPGSNVAGTSMSPMFKSNNVGKTGLCVDLKSEGGRRVVHELIRRADVLVENFRAGVTARMGIDPETVRELNPDLVYLSLSSQGAVGPESRYGSYGSTLDLLSGLAGATGYRGGAPIWSSGEVNYPDQIVAIAGAALVAHAVATGRVGARMDISQRELVAWTLADQLAAYVWEGMPIQPTGNRRPGTTPHDVYATADKAWLALACTADGHRRALAGVVPGLPVDADEQWWWDNQDHVDAQITEWTSTRTRDEAVTALQAAGVPAVPVCTAADRAVQSRYRERRIASRSADGQWLKGFPLILRAFAPAVPGPAPALTEDVPDPETERFATLLAELLPAGDGYR